MTTTEYHELKTELTFTRTPAERGERGSHGEPVTPDVSAECQLVSATVVDEAVCAMTPGWTNKLPEEDGWYFLHEGKGDSTVVLIYKGRIWWAASEEPLSLFQMGGARWSRVLPPGTPVPVTLDLERVPKARRAEWEASAMREVTR